MIRWCKSFSDDAYRIFQEVRQPYTETNRSYSLFSVGFAFLLGQAVARPLRILVDIVKRFQVENPPLQNVEIIRYCQDFLFFLVPLILVGLGIHYRKKW